MVIAARFGRIVPTLELTRGAQSHGAYVENPDGSIKGLIYAPFVEFVWRSFGIGAIVRTGPHVGDIAEIMKTSDFFIASVHHTIWTPDRLPPQRGGHLVLVTQADEDIITFNNPSGHTAETRGGTRLASNDSAHFFAGRGIAILPADAP